MLNPPVLLLSPRLPVPELEWARWSPDEELPSVRVSTGGGPKRGTRTECGQLGPSSSLKRLPRESYLGPRARGEELVRAVLVHACPDVCQQVDMRAGRSPWNFRTPLKRPLFALFSCRRELVKLITGVCSMGGSLTCLGKARGSIRRPWS